MNSNVKFIFGMVVGAAVGILCTKKYFAKKEQERADEEIASVKERFTVPRENKEEKRSEKSPEKKKDIPEEKTVSPITRRYTMSGRAEKAMNIYRGEPIQDDDKNEYPIIVISPDEFEENELEYEHQNLTYYADGIVTDDQDHVLDYPEDILGNNFEELFGEYEPDSIHIRNKEKGVDYEVLKDMRKFKNVLNERPRPVNIK